MTTRLNLYCFTTVLLFLFGIHKIYFKWKSRIHIIQIQILRKHTKLTSECFSLLANENIQTTDKKNEDYISELKNQIENFKEQNETLNLKLLEHQEKDNNEEKIQVSELQQKIKYYQDESLRLSNLVVNNE